ncbi:unnamed protein product [Trichogramma brassicae]|uniref:Uncharacterized protein n=1 Tax=Trichogramma brassicae TaxID=86971 RepID=A0A6H5IXK6_9HYME|nr:unnamed protein product [Trichogramma brassicae]
MMVLQVQDAAATPMLETSKYNQDKYPERRSTQWLQALYEQQQQQLYTEFQYAQCTGVYRLESRSKLERERESRAQLEPQLESTGSSHRLQLSSCSTRFIAKITKVAYEQRQQQCAGAPLTPRTTYSTERARAAALGAPTILPRGRSFMALELALGFLSSESAVTKKSSSDNSDELISIRWTAAAAASTTTTTTIAVLQYRYAAVASRLYVYMHRDKLDRGSSYKRAGSRRRRRRQCAKKFTKSLIIATAVRDFNLSWLAHAQTHTLAARRSRPLLYCTCPMKYFSRATAKRYVPALRKRPIARRPMNLRSAACRSSPAPAILSLIRSNPTRIILPVPVAVVRANWKKKKKGGKGTVHKNWQNENAAVV